MRRHIKIYEAFDVNQINAALGFLENNGDGVAQTYGDKSLKVAKAILVDLRDNGDMGRDYSLVKEIGKADEVYKKALDVAVKVQSANATAFSRLSGMGSGIKTFFERTINGQDFILGTKEEETE